MSIADWPARKMANGGMAEVFLALKQGIAGFSRPVVVKRIKRELSSDARAVELFLSEARLAAQLEHPNIVAIDEVLQEGGRFFLVMEYLAGEDLRTVLRARRESHESIPLPVVGRIALDLAAGLEYAHTATDLEGRPLGVVHRDISPSNVVVDYAGTTKLIDFGVAQANSHYIYTKPSVLRGKLAYGSPEQLEHLPLDAQSDVWSLGVVVHELLTGHRLFRGDSPNTIVKAVMEQVIEPPSVHNPAVPPEMDAVVMHALERDRAERTADAGTFLVELRSVLEANGLLAGDDRVAEWMQAHFGQRRAQRERFAQSLVEEPPGALLADRVTTASQSILPGPPEQGAHYLSSMSAAVVPAQTRPPKRRGLGLGLGALLLLGAAMLAYWKLGRSESGVLVQTDPPGAELRVNGGAPLQVGAQGVMLKAAPGKTLHLEASREGFQAVERDLTVGDRIREVVMTLSHTTASAPVATADARPSANQVAAPAPPPAVPTLPQPAAPQQEVPAASPSLRRPMRGAGRRRVGRAGTASPSESVVPVVPTQPSPDPAPARPELAHLDIVTSPTGAQISVDGRPRGASPVLGLDVEPGHAHTVVATLAGYETFQTRVTPTAGRNPPLVATLTATPAPQQPSPSAAAPAAPSPQTRQAALRLPTGTVGDARRGAGLASSRCGSCHGRSAGRLDPRRYTGDQWARYFATGRHVRRAPLASVLSRSQLADVKAYLMAHSADAARATAAGVR